LASTSIEIDRHASFIFHNNITLRQYLTDLTWLQSCTESSSIRISTNTSYEEHHAARHRAYPQAVSILYASTVTRPDLSQAPGVLSRFISKCNESHWKAAKHLLRYIRGTSDLCLTLTAESGDRIALGYADADWGGDLDTRRSTTGYVIKVYGGTVAWKSRRQPTVLSTTEAEYMASADAARQAIA